MRKDAHHRLLEITTAQKEAELDPKRNEAILVLCRIFRPDAEVQASRQASFIEKSMPTGDA